MTDAELVAFLTWATDRLRIRWTGLKAFRGTVRKRLHKRLAELGIGDLETYRARVESDPLEEERLAAMCRIPISRLYRDRAVFDRLATDILPERARVAATEGRSTVRVWSAGCASGEEPHSVAMVWHVDVAPRLPPPGHPEIALEIVATDADEGMLERARRGAYGAGSVRELPDHLRDAALRHEGSQFVVRDELRAGITFHQQDIRREMPDGPFDVVLCRNMLLTYVDEREHVPLLSQIVARLRPGGVLVVGRRETMPPALSTLHLEPLDPSLPGVYRASGGAID
ncbi:MAG: Chemotaxis protein methyltransferase CheR [Labilithrix sp.]|nr:Chemotaxis protein methyltransferase CheR [Labilithrix sp.]